MKKYLIKRILFSLFSLVMVIGIVTILIYQSLDRTSILVKDPRYSKYSNNEQTMYEYASFSKYGYLSYETIEQTADFKALSEERQAEITTILQTGDSLETIMGKDQFISDYVKKMQSKRYDVKFLPAKTRRGRIYSNPYLVSVYEKNVFERLGEFFAGLFRFETIYDVKDDSLTDRYIRLEWDKRSNMPALVGSGTTHKYLVYFDNKFPFVHQNIFHIRLGNSFTISKNQDVVEYMLSYTGATEYVDQITPKNIDNPDATAENLPYDFHTVTYNPNSASSYEAQQYYPEGEMYTSASMLQSGFTKIGTSFLVGIVATFIAYFIGLPLGIWMAQRKDKAVDKIGNAYIIFIMAVPSLAYIYMFALIGITLFKLPATTQLNTGAAILGYILPTISLALPSIGALMKWMRRYMIDQKNSDYVKFARSQGLSEGEIFSKHISKNAFIFLVHGIPADILAALVGAIITERVYGVPGIGNMLTDAIEKLDNPVILGVTAFYTLITIVALIAGDLLLAKYDPRISFSKGGN